MRKQAGNIDKEAKQGSRKLSVRATWDHEQFRFLSELMSVMDGGLLVVGVSGVDRVAGTDGVVCAVTALYTYTLSPFASSRVDASSYPAIFSLPCIPNFVGFNSVPSSVT